MKERERNGICSKIDNTELESDNKSSEAKRLRKKKSPVISKGLY